MFTGIISCVGEIQATEKRGNETRLRLLAPQLSPFVQGESIAVNGLCLTVETYTADWFTAYASQESLTRSNLGALHPGSHVNLERALAVGDRLGGHLVSGHVDCVAKLVAITPAGESQRYKLTFPDIYSPQVIEKGSVCLDGISLTINDCGQGFLAVNIIPETQRATTIHEWTVGRSINLETDLIGKYVQSMVAPWLPKAAQQKAPQMQTITETFLRENGF